MSEIFEDNEEDKLDVIEDDVVQTDEILKNHRTKPVFVDARRRLEALMEEKRLQNELDDFLYEGD